MIVFLFLGVWVNNWVVGLVVLDRMGGGNTMGRDIAARKRYQWIGDGNVGWNNDGYYG